MFFNFKHVEFFGLKRKVFINKGVRYEFQKTGKIIINGGCLEIGKPWSRKAVFPTLLQLGNNSKIIVKGQFRIFEGANISVNDDASLVLGSGRINYKLNLACFESIIIGDDVSISEGVTIRDSDNHNIKYPGYVMTQV